mmetsp:Transcript_8582/g.13013  ORF Transcript_8582/g.13013 Transcript_8582/m.13013 type:complete len:399 (+) Transcript_8582:52-1248(+)|eukprot:CAMPEP_0201535758 /NCGR_PEP_ID=MMETSP0161_2-20130828/59941_1 /ASSEMBLY_ACC=CAM_ASM_000251 /TAXON_ID=180227 /ORGANISM="Neoparamoeba aestuarina, Strain SoJaBio B1-5/56/2" /LENGTH=398 /DNA_ID=CAMNT_0047941105 /DNA_START=30 /DNA_END=1226 /DNA_ORIENTATION=-
MVTTQGARWRSCKGMTSPPTTKKGHIRLRSSIRNFATKYLFRAASFTIPKQRKIFRLAGKQGLLGVTIDRRYGGLGMDTTSSVIVHHEISKVSPGFGLAYLAHSILFAHNFSAATHAQKQAILPKICSGERVGALALSERGSGTDIKAMRTHVHRSSKGFILNGSKMWITNGPLADYFLVYAVLIDEGMSARQDTSRAQQIGCFLVKKGVRGFAVGSTIPKCGMQPAVMCELKFKNVMLSSKNLVGGFRNCWKDLMATFEIERLGLAAIALGIAERSLEEMIKHAHCRHSFGRPLYSYGQIQKYISEGFSEASAAKALIYSVSASKSLNRLMTDATKLFTSPIAKRIADNAIQVCGAVGYSKKMNLEQFWRDAKLLEIGGGTLEAHQKNIVTDIMRSR